MAQPSENKLKKIFDQNVEITGTLIVGGSAVLTAETDPGVPSHVKSITTTNISNWNSAYSYSQVGHLPLTGGNLTGDLNLQYSGSIYSRAIKFQGASASAYEIGIRANGEGLEIYEPEDVNKVWLTISDDPSGNASALQVNSEGGMTPVVTNYNKDSYITKSYIDGLNVDADTLDNLNSTQFLRSDVADTMSGQLTLNTGSYNPLRLDRTGSNNVNISFWHNNDLKGYLGVGNDGLLTFGGNADSAANSVILHSTNYSSYITETYINNLISNDYLPSTGGTLTGNLSIDIADTGSAPAMTNTLRLKGYEGRGVGIKIQDSINSATSPNNREWFIGSGYSQSGFNIGYASDGVQSSYAAQNKFSLSTSGNGIFAGTVEASNLSGTNTGDQDLSGYLLNTTDTLTGDLIVTNNVGIGTTSPSNKLSLAGSGQNWNTSPAIKMWDSFNSKGWYVGSANNDVAGDFYIRSVTDEDLYPVSANQQFTIKQNGNVGIGTISPSEKLSILGVKNTPIIHLGSTTSDSSWAVGDKIGAIEFGSADGSGAGGGVKASISYEVEAGITGSTNSMVFRSAGTAAGTNNAERMRINSSGNVGIGTTNPQQHQSGTETVLHIANPNIASLNLEATASSGQTYVLSSASSGSFLIYNDDTNTTPFLITNSGDVGIGTSSPSAFLHLKGGMSYGSFRISPSIANGESAMAFFTDVAGANTSNAWVIGHAGWGHTGDFVIGNQANGGSVMLMQQNGNVGIGTTSPDAKLHAYQSGTSGSQAIVGVLGSDSLRPVLQFSESTSGSITSGMSIEYNGVGTGDNNYMVVNSAANVPRFTVTSGGNVGIGTTSPVGKLNVALPADSDGNVGAWSSNQVVFTRGGTNTSQGLGFSVNDAANSATISSLTPAITWSDLVYRAKNHSFYSNGTALTMYLDSSNNVGIGTSSPSAKIDVIGSAYFRGNTRVINGMGTAGSLSASQLVLNTTDVVDTTGWQGISFETSTASGYGWSIGANRSGSGRGSFRFYEHNNSDIGSERFTLLEGGNVGIGTSSPDSKVHIEDAVNRSMNGSGEGQFQITGNGYTFGIALDATAAHLYHNSAGRSLILGTNEQPRLTIEPYGNVGIGTTSPVRRLHVFQAGDYWHAAIGGNNGELRIGGETGSGAVIQAYTPAGVVRNLFLQRDGGNVGIGTTSPAYKLQVQKTSIATPAFMVGGAYYGGPRIQTYGLDADSNAWMGLGTDMGGAAYEHSIYFPDYNGNGRLTFGTYNGTTYSTKATLLNNGNFGIGTTSPEAELHIYGAQPYIYITNTAENGAGIIFNDAQAPTGQAASILFNSGNETLGFFVNDASTERVRIQTNGDTHFSGDVVAYSTSISDERLKDNIETIPNALDKVNLLRGVSYVWNEGSRKGQKDLGLIAQEVEKVLPEIVREKEMSLIDDSGIAYKTIDYEKMVGVLIEAVKDLSNKVEELEKKINGTTSRK